jgi:hypothetical protein
MDFIYPWTGAGHERNRGGREQIRKGRRSTVTVVRSSGRIRRDIEALSKGKRIVLRQPKQLSSR